MSRRPEDEASRDEGDGTPLSQPPKDREPSVELPPIQFVPTFIEALKAFDRFVEADRKDIDLRLQHLNEAVRLNPHNVAILLVRAEYLVEAGNYTQAAEDLVHAIERTSDITLMRIALGQFANVFVNAPKTEQIINAKARLGELVNGSRNHRYLSDLEAFVEHHVNGEYKYACQFLAAGAVKSLPNGWQYSGEYEREFERIYGKPWYQ